MKLLHIFSLITLLLSSAIAQQTFTLKENRVKFKAGLEQKIDSILVEFLETGKTERLQDAFWGSGLLMNGNPKLNKTLRRIFSDPTNYEESLLRAALEVTAACYPSEFKDIFSDLTVKLKSPKLFAMSAVYLYKNGTRSETLLEMLSNTFAVDTAHPILIALYNYLKAGSEVSSHSLADLLNYQYESNIIFSLQYKDRNKPGFVVLKKPKNVFITTDGRQLFTPPQLARSLSNLPGFLTNGNTPQGIFSIRGIDTSSNLFIGNTPNLQIAMPFEAPAEEYFKGKQDGIIEYTLENYLSILPESWSGSTQIAEAFLAGKAGRSEIIAHGTATDITYYVNKVFFPYTPTLGCLCMREEWSEETGELVVSDQQVFIDKLIKENILTGYLIVVEVDESITPDTISKLINK